VGGVLSLVFNNFIHFSSNTGISVTAPAHPPPPGCGSLQSPGTPGCPGRHPRRSHARL
jgi:hypothetical protein